MNDLQNFSADNRLSFASDYMEGAYPCILERLQQTNLLKTAGYGLDSFSESARSKIRECCAAPDADIFFLIGGTQTNAVIIDAFLRPWQGVIAPVSGHIAVHEAGAVEFGGHKVLALPQTDGKLSCEIIASCLSAWKEDENRNHMVMPGLVYLSQPTEFGTLYSRKELEHISRVCHDFGIPLYVDGARLAYALACPENDVTLPALAEFCDAFYIGGTKCGALFGEAVVIPKHNTLPHFFTIMKQHGALLAKGRIAGIQFDTLFSDGLYSEIGRIAIDSASRIRAALLEKGYCLAFPSPTNQLFPLLENRQAERLSEKVDMSFWERVDENHVIMRLATSWATRDDDVSHLISLL